MVLYGPLILRDDASIANHYGSLYKLHTCTSQLWSKSPGWLSSRFQLVYLDSRLQLSISKLAPVAKGSEQ